MTSSMTHDSDGRPIGGCINAPYQLAGSHSWRQGELDCWEYPHGVKGDVLGDRMDTCSKCGLNVRVVVESHANKLEDNHGDN